MTDVEYHGPDRRKKTEVIHPWRWRLLAIWILVFTLLAFAGLRDNRERVNELNKTKANVAQLQRTNCALRSFLHAAGEARRRAATRDKSPAARQTDLDAAKRYFQLASKFQGECE